MTTKASDAAEVFHFPIIQQRDDTGTKLEPEETVIVREQKANAETTLGNNPDSAKPLPITVQTEHTALELANTLTHQCGGCKHYDHKSGQDYIRRSMHPAAPREAQEDINKLRIALMTSQNMNILDAISRPDGLEDADQLLTQFGKCHRLSELHVHDTKDGVHVLPFSSCPPEYKTAMHPEGFYEPRFQRDDAKARDSILLRAMRRR